MIDLMTEGRVALGDHGSRDDLPSHDVLVGCRRGGGELFAAVKVDGGRLLRRGSWVRPPW
jgi:hypothetical protein